MILNDIFAAARERIGGKDEAEMQYRFPDSRLWLFYEQDFKPLLFRKVKMAESSFSTDQTISAGTSKLALGSGDYRLTSVHLISGGSDAGPVEVVTAESIEREGNLLSETGAVQKVYVYSLGATVYLGLWPVPTDSTILRIEGVGTPTSEFVYDSTTDLRWETAGGAAAFDSSTGALASRTTAVLPNQFFTSAACYLAHRMLESMEEYVDRPQAVEMARARFERMFLQDVGAFNMAVSGSRMQSRGVTRRVRY